MTVGVTERLRDMASRLPDAIQVSCFGMTEASSFLSLSYLTDTLEQRVTTGGHPMPGMECRVVDPVTGVDLPPDTEGELLFRGSNGFSGYLNDPGLTAQVFDDEGWFHTMDVATMDPDGRVTFISRLKDMLKVGGENVSAAEVESYLLRHLAIGHRPGRLRARRLLRRGPGRVHPAQARGDGHRAGDHRLLRGQDRDLPGAALRPVRRRVADVRHQDQEGDPARDDRRGPQGEGHLPGPQDRDRPGRLKLASSA